MSTVYLQQMSKSNNKIILNTFQKQKIRNTKINKFVLAILNVARFQFQKNFNVVIFNWYFNVLIYLFFKRSRIVKMWLKVKTTNKTKNFHN